MQHQINIAFKTNYVYEIKFPLKTICENTSIQKISDLSVTIRFFFNITEFIELSNL